MNTSSSSASSSSSDEWIAMVSGLDIGAESPSDAQIQLLLEYLTGEASNSEDQISASQISRLIIAGNSFAPMGAGGEHDTEIKKPVGHSFTSDLCADG
jgi:DNA polymerase delta subunit 2